MLSRSESLKELIRRLVEESRERQEESRGWHEESRDWHEETRVAFAENRAALEEFREFNREILLRNEKVYTSVIVRLEELGAETRANSIRTHESAEETRAHTQALLRLLDWIDEHGGPTMA